MNSRCLVQCFIGSFIGLAACVDDAPKSLFSDVESLPDVPVDLTPSGGGLTEAPGTAAPGPEAEDGAEPPRDDRFGTPFPDESDCDVPLELLANDGVGGAAFAVPLEDDHYECFYFAA